MGIVNFYNNNWKALTLVTIVILVIAASFLVYNTLTTGAPLERDIELIGGKLITINLQNQPDINKLSSEIPEVRFKLVSGIQTTLLVEAGADANETEILEKLNNLGVSGEYSIKTIGPALGEVFWRQAQIAIIAAFIIMSFVVFLLFRSLAPSIAVILAATTDIVVAMFGMSLFGIELSLPTLAALLMLIGYSVDTDIVLTTEMLKSKERVLSESIKPAFKTGITMTSAAIAALIAMYFVSGSFVLQKMALVLIIGLLADIPATWLTNVGILRWYMEKKEAKK